MRLGLLGGTFNPIHICHLTIAAQARDHLSLDRILFIPAGDPPHKPHESLAPAPHRREMVKLAIEHEPTFALSEVELRRPAKSYSIDTVRELRRELDSATELFFIIGLDSFLEFPTWRQAATLIRMCTFVVVSRPNVEFATLLGFPLLPGIDPATLETLDLSRQERADLHLPDGTQVILLRLPPCGVSASEIRHRVRTGQGLEAMLPGPVESYIIRYKLYQEEADRTRL